MNQGLCLLYPTENKSSGSGLGEVSELQLDTVQQRL